MSLKKLFCIFLPIIILLSLCACNNTEIATNDQQILRDRRQAVVDEMHHMMTFLWSTDEDITYSKENYSRGLDKDKPNQIITLKAGRIYSGLPYTHGCGSAYDFQAFATESELKDFQLFHLIDPQEVKVGSLDLETLKPGTYHCTHTCRLSTGDELTVRDFDFTVE